MRTQQAQAMMFRTREMFFRQRTQLINAVQADLMEYGIVLPHHTAMAACLQNAAAQNLEMLRKSSLR
jgi:transposase